MIGPREKEGNDVFIQHILSIYYMPGTELGPEDTVMNKTKVLSSKVYILVRRERKTMKGRREGGKTI